MNDRRQIGLAVTILQVLADVQLCANAFVGGSWQAWRAFLATLFALPLPPDLRLIAEACTGRTVFPTAPVTEAWCLVGRRGGKSCVAALIAVFLACFRRYDEVLRPGERGYVLVVAADRKQGRHVMGYINGLLDASPFLAALVERRTEHSIDLRNHITIEIRTGSFRTIRGYTVVAAICDEVAFWRTDESANPDTEVLNALRPAMATVPGALLLAITTPYARRGEAYRAYLRHYGQNASRVLVWRAPSRDMNPQLSQADVDDAYERDAAAAATEYGAAFRSDLEAVFTVEALAAVTAAGVTERPRRPSRQYTAVVDPSAGVHDSMVLAIAGVEEGRPTLMFVCEVRPRFSPETVVADFAQHCARYGVTTVIGDRYAGAWVTEAFQRHGIRYTPSAHTKSEWFGALVAAVHSRRVELLDLPRLHAQLIALERRTHSGGRDTIDHPQGAHDDVANAAAGALMSVPATRPDLASIADMLSMGHDDPPEVPE